MSSGIFKQAVTPVKPHGRVGGLTNANAFAVGRAQVEKALSVDGSETSQVSSVKAGRIFLLVLRSGLAGRSPLQ